MTAEVLEPTALPLQDAASMDLTMSVELGRRWPLLLAVMLGMCFGTAGQSYWFGALVGPMTRANGWTLSEISSWTAFACVAGLLVKPVAGWLADQYGPRIVAIAGAALLAVATSSASLAGPHLVAFYVSASLVGLFGAFDMAYYRVVVASFNSARGVALGIMFSGSALSALIGPRLMIAVVDHYGVPGGFLLMGGVALIPLPFLYFGMPRSAPARSRQARAREQGHSVAEALKLPTFWLVLAATLLHSQATAGLLFHVFPYLTSTGLSRVSAAGYVSLFGISAIVGKLGMGLIIDNLPPSAVCMMLMVVEAAAVLIIAVRPDTVAFTLPLLGFAYGGGMPCTMYYVPRLFGVRNYGAIGGLLASAAAICYAFAPLAFSELKAVGGGYELPFLCMAVGLLCCGLIYMYFGLRGVVGASRVGDFERGRSTI